MQSEYEEDKAMVHVLQMLAWVADPKEQAMQCETNC
jgi:hypothetical protein